MSILSIDKKSKEVVTEMSVLFGISQRALQSFFEVFFTYTFLKLKEKDKTAEKFTLPYFGEFEIDLEKQSIKGFKPCCSFEKVLKESKTVDNELIQVYTDKIVQLLSEEKEIKPRTKTSTRTRRSRTHGPTQT